MAEDATHGAAAAHAAADAAHGGGPGMPQLDFSTFPNQIFWLIVTLVAIYFILDKVACRGSRPFWPNARGR
jgi:F-type H+-transporting ATPase subunit b